MPERNVGIPDWLLRNAPNAPRQDGVAVAYYWVKKEPGFVLKSIKIKGFRGFESLEVGNLRRVNLIVGESAAGKTAFLEAVRLALGATPNVAWQLNAYRGLLFGMPAPPAREVFEAAWSSFFYDFNVKNDIELGVTDAEGRDASVRIYFDANSPVSPTVGGPLANIANLNLPGMTSAGTASPLTIIPLAFERTSFVGEQSRLLATVLPPNGQLHFESGPELGPAQEYFAASALGSHLQVASWFSQASTANNERGIIAAVSGQFPLVTDLSVQAPPGQPPSIYATVKNKPRKLPLSLVSSGITKFLSAITAVRQFHGGVVLIDEIENGIYFKKLTPLLSALHQSSVAADTQLFLTTHSLECLQAASEVMETAPEDFALVQMIQDKHGSQAIVVPGKGAAAAISNGIEVRNVSKP